MRNESAPSSSIRSASRSNWSATCSFLGSAAVTAAIIGRHMRATVCIPTYNEHENLEPMLRTLATVLRDGDRVLVTDAELILEMDCDFSHDPKDVLRLIAAVEGGADVAVGSRYVSGGSIPTWGAIRRFVSFGGSVYARIA